MEKASQYRVRDYATTDFLKWNAFVAKAPNATFLFHRDFIEYHQDRFTDYSLIVEDDNDWVAVLPANIVDTIVYSHQGLTYGGLVVKPEMSGSEIPMIWDSIFLHLQANHISKWIYKPILHFYSSIQEEVLDFHLNQKGKLFRKDLGMVIHFNEPFTVAKAKRKHHKKAHQKGLFMQLENDLEPFWNAVLIPRLMEKYQAQPVHSLTEIQYLKEKFPENILQYSAYCEDQIVAGITLFVFKNGIKSQYGATTLKGEETRALDFLFVNLIEKYKKEFAFFDMGTVSSNDNKSINKGLFDQKKEYGCVAYEQKFYEFSL